jgi:hypothetical protein
MFHFSAGLFGRLMVVARAPVRHPEGRRFDLLRRQVRSAQINSPIRKKAEGGSSSRPFGTYQPPSLASG